MILVFDFITYFTQPLEKMQINENDKDLNDPKFKELLKKLGEMGMPVDQNEL